MKADKRFKQKNGVYAVTVRFSKEQFDELDRLAKSNDRSKAAQIINLVKHALDKGDEIRN